MADVKIVLVGGGSYSWGPSVIGNILKNEYLDGCQVVLHDLDEGALEMNFQLAGMLREQVGAETAFERTTDQAEALEGADFVVVTISTGGLGAMRVDLEKFAKHMARESGATDLGEFIRPETETSALLSILPDGQIPEQVAAGNLVPNQPEGQPGIL